ncbi:MAG: DMT family transporter [Acidimicrobiia bacterium]|jgi:drug/metabolite transporter (DMT)-like permease
MTRRTIQPHHRTLAAALLGAVMISFSAIYYALSDTSPTTAAFFRAAYAIPVLIVLWLLGRSRDHRPVKRRWLALAAGLSLGADAVAWHTSIEYIGAGLATLLANTSVVFVALGAWLLLGERPRRETLLAIPAILLGVTMVSGLGQGNPFGSDPLKGTAFALLAAMLYAGFILGFRHSNDEHAPPAGPLLEATVGTLIASMAIGLVGQSIDFSITWPSHGWLIVLAIGSQVFGWLLIGYALPRLPAAETATIILLQPALTMVWGALIFDERPSVVQIVGAIVVLAGVSYVALVRARRQAEPAPVG